MAPYLIIRDINDVEAWQNHLEDNGKRPMTKTTLAGDQIPTHVAIIMDGNGRWAQKHGLSRIEGHREGAKSVQAVMRACRESAVRYLTLYAFSTENWSRPKLEIMGLMDLLVQFMNENEQELHQNQIRLRTIGRLADLPAPVQFVLQRVSKATQNYDRYHLILALSYGARHEITQAMRVIAQKIKNGELNPEQIDEAAIARHLFTEGIPDPDLLIRTSGEMRLSNFLLWQVSYTELYVTETLWPDFRENDFLAALAAYAQRRRRFGRVQTNNRQSE
ncbi:MAG: isoprenyl transferase [Kiritimatiellia bacterium]|nr:isoprenyl transferase [Kiritimatiellia bacterium]